MPIRTYPPEEWKILSHVFLTPNIDWYPSVLNFTAAEYYEYDERLEIFDQWAGTAEHVVHTMNFKALTGYTLNFLFCYDLNFTEEPTAFNPRLEYILGGCNPS